MWELIKDFILPTKYIPHGNCYLWQPSLVSLHSVSDILIALSYYSIPALLLYFVRNRTDVPFKEIFLLFSAFILSCGTTHILEVWTLWYPAYWLSAWVKVTTALISIYTVIELIPVLPLAIALPSPGDLENLNMTLKAEISEKEAAQQEILKLNDQLEKRVIERTASLQKVTQELLQEIEERRKIELALRDSKHFVERIIDLTPGILSIYDLVENRNVYCNRFITDLLGYNVEEIQNMAEAVLKNLLHPLDYERFHQDQENWLTNNAEEFLETEYRVQDIKGEWHWIYSKKAIFEYTENGIPKQIISLANDITERKQAESELQALNEQLAERIEQLEQRHQELIKLGEMNDFLQACLTVTEAEGAIGDLLSPLFPKFSGSLLMMDSSQDLVEEVASWGNCLNTETVFSPSECWSLRRGSLYKGETSYPSLYCPHIHSNKPPKTTLCIPMMAQGETLGLLYLSASDSKLLTPAKQQLAETVSKQIALSFANLKLQESLQNQSFLDPLTGLYNRRYLEKFLLIEIRRATIAKKCISIIMLDLDHFKHFNDVYGHEVGDLVLVEVGSFLQKNIRNSDVACRYGGEELTVIMPGASLETAKERAEKLRQGIRNLLLKHEGQELNHITASFGVACFPEHGETAKIILRAADQALYLAKKQGRDRVVCFS